VQTSPGTDVTVLVASMPAGPPRLRWFRARPVRGRDGDGTTSMIRSLAGSRLVVAVRRLGQHRWTGTCQQARVSRSRWSDAAAGLVAGVLVFASLPPRGWWWAAVIGLGVLSAVLAQASPRRRLLTGACTGLGWFGPGLAWVNGFSPPGYGLLVAVQVAMLAAACLLAGRHWWLLPTALVVFTAARDRFPLGGFPLAGLELGQVGGPLAAVSPLLGPLGVVAVTALAAAGAAQTLRRRRPAPLLAVALALGLAAAGWLLPVAPTGPTLRVAVVQGGGPRGIPAVRADAAAVLDRQLQQTALLQPGEVDLVVWPENVVSLHRPLTGSPTATLLGAEARRLHAALLVGVTEPAEPGHFRNAAVLFDTNGVQTGRYDKVHRVPFGEYIPARGLLSRVVNLAQVPADAVPGHGPGLLHSGAHQLGVIISYEVFFPDRARAAVLAGGQLLLLPTNAASYTGPAVPAEEVAASRLRALETARTVVQAAPTGYSALINETGHAHQRSALGQPGLLHATLALSNRTTPYAHTGDLPALALALAFAVLTTTVIRRPTHWSPNNS